MKRLSDISWKVTPPIVVVLDAPRTLQLNPVLMIERLTRKREAAENIMLAAMAVSFCRKECLLGNVPPWGDNACMVQGRFQSVFVAKHHTAHLLMITSPENRRY